MEDEQARSEVEVSLVAVTGSSVGLSTSIPSSSIVFSG